MAAKKWIPIVAGIAIFVVVVGVGAVGGLIYLVTRQVNVQTVSSAVDGQQEFERMVASFAGQKPFIELSAETDQPSAVHHELATGKPGALSTLHLRIWIPREKKLARIDLPFWLMRLTGNNPIKIHTDHDSFDRLSLQVTPEEIDRRGPGLLLNHTARGGERILVWTD